MEGSGECRFPVKRRRHSLLFVLGCGGSTSGETTLLGFQGDLTDPDSGLVDMTTRLYDPGLGRFLTRDVVPGEPTRPMTFNQFLYVSNSPVSRNDPLGLCDPSMNDKIVLGEPCNQTAFRGGSGGGGGGGDTSNTAACDCSHVPTSTTSSSTPSPWS